jgi:hypothetical protein
MRSRIGFITMREGLNLKQSGTDILLKWKEWTGTTTQDPTTGSTLGTSVDKSEIIKGFPHYIKATTTVRQFAELEVGDCLLDLHRDQQLKGRNGLVFVIAGEEWKQKEIAGKVASYANAIASNQKIFQTVVLRKTT